MKKRRLSINWTGLFNSFIAAVLFVLLFFCVAWVLSFFLGENRIQNSDVYRIVSMDRKVKCIGTAHVDEEYVVELSRLVNSGRDSFEVTVDESSYKELEVASFSFCLFESEPTYVAYSKGKGFSTVNSKDVVRLNSVVEMVESPKFLVSLLLSVFPLTWLFYFFGLCECSKGNNT